MHYVHHSLSLGKFYQEFLACSYELDVMCYDVMCHDVMCHDVMCYDVMCHDVTPYDVL